MSSKQGNTSDRGARTSSISKTQVAAAAILLLAGTAAHAKKTFYVSNDGNDANSGTTPASPWKTIAKVNTVLPLLGPSDAVLLHRGDVFRDDYIRCVNTRTVTAGMTVAGARPTCSGSSTAPVTIAAYGAANLPAPLIDGADPLSLTWNLVSGTTWEAKITGTMPTKLYVDAATRESTQLLPVPNATGLYVANATYSPFDAVIQNGIPYVRGVQPAAAGVSPLLSSTWVNMANNFTGNTSQTFSLTNSGEQNVKATPGSWYGAGDTIVVNLPDGSNPNEHSFQGTQRPYGVVLYGVNHVIVRGLAIGHVQQSAILSAASPSMGTYFTGEYNRIIGNRTWNYGSIANDSFSLGGNHTNAEVAGIVVRASGDYNPHLVVGNYVGGNYVGTMDGYFAVRSAVHSSGIMLAGIDGGGTANNVIAEKNYVRTVNTRGIVYNMTGIYISGPVMRNLGGRITNNELVNNQGNIFFSTVQGGMEDHNRIHHSYGQGVQTGGNSLSSSTEPQVHAFNLIYHLGEGGSHGQFNGFDCAGDLVNGYWLNNTVYDVYGATLTFETGCSNVHVHNNILDQNTLQFPAYKIINESYVMYFDHGAGNVNPDFSNNVWVPGPQWHPFFGNHDPFTCSTFFSKWPDKDSFCTKDPGFTNPDAGNFTLKANSPALTAAEDGGKAGAIR